MQSTLSKPGLLLRQGFAVLACAGLGLTACGGNSSTAPAEVSEGEAQALEEAAEMLDERQLPDEAVGDLAPPQTVPQETAEMTGDSGE